jgi:hypothetical protein
MESRAPCPFLADADPLLPRVCVVGLDVGTVRCGVASFEATVHLSAPAASPPPLDVDPDGALRACTCSPRARVVATRLAAAASTSKGTRTGLVRGVSHVRLLCLNTGAVAEARGRVPRQSLADGALEFVRGRAAALVDPLPHFAFVEVQMNPIMQYVEGLLHGTLAAMLAAAFPPGARPRVVGQGSRAKTRGIGDAPPPETAAGRKRPPPARAEPAARDRTRLLGSTKARNAELKRQVRPTVVGLLRHGVAPPVGPGAARVVEAMRIADGWADLCDAFMHALNGLLRQRPADIREQWHALRAARAALSPPPTLPELPRLDARVLARFDAALARRTRAPQ